MRKLIINGGKPLYGSVNIGGSKNAVLPIMFASISARGICEIVGFPRIGDTEVAIEILESLGAVISLSGDVLTIDTRNLTYKTPPEEQVKKIRASTYLIGACLARFGECELQNFGGCNFSARPIDLHLYAASQMGAKRENTRLFCDALVGSYVDLSKPSVGATVNALIMASSAEGTSVIRGYAKEPHVMLLIGYLKNAGAEIIVGENEITVKGGALHGGRVRIIADMIEAGSYLTLGLVTGGEIEVVGDFSESMQPYVSLIREMEGNIVTEENKITVMGQGKLKYGRVTAAPYPAFPTDLQPIIAPLFAKNSGGEIEDTVFPDRFGYLNVLASFGIRSKRDSSRAEIFPSKLECASVAAPCLRGGASCLISALGAKGQSVIDTAELFLRGYESPVEKLISLGADIELI